MKEKNEFEIEYGKILIESLSSERKEKVFKIMEDYFTEEELLEMKGVAKKIVDLRIDMDNRLSEYNKRAS